ncbi:MAG: rhodanese-like domain-containing protein [Fusobacteria bacterium]|nr:rhodanese-like domain-containing protein [Fusobacteriota bacterium]
MSHINILSIVMDIIIIVLAVILARDFWKHKKAGYKLITPSEFKSMYNSLDKNTEIIDLRSPTLFAKEKVFKSRNLNVYGGEFKKTLETLDERKTFIVFADKTNTTKHGAYLFCKAGVVKVYAVKGNWDKIKASGVTLK